MSTDDLREYYASCDPGTHMSDRVLDALTKQSKEDSNGTGKKKGATTHIPFRDSALTKLLADSMGGNCRTTMIAAVGPASCKFTKQSAAVALVIYGRF
jgi:hypothetical protein